MTDTDQRSGQGDAPTLAPPRRVQLGQPRRRYSPMAAIVVAAFGAFLAFMDSTIVNVAFPSIRAAFPKASVSNLTWILNSYNIVFAGFLVFAGRFADLLGRRRLFRLGLVVFTGASALCAVANSVDLVIVFRVVQAVGAAMLVPASLGIVVHAATGERRNHALSLWAAAAALAAGLGPPIGGALVDFYNWRLVFLINVPLGIAAWLLARRMVVESRAPGVRVMPDLKGALLLSMGLGSLAFGIVQGGTWGWQSPAVLGAFALAIMAIALTVLSSRNHRSPVLDPALLKIRSFAVSNLVTIACGLGLYTYLLAHILWLHYIWGYSLLLAGLAVAPGAAVAAVVALPCGRLADRFGPRTVAVPGALVWCGAFVWYATRVGLTPDFVGQWLPGQILSGIGVGATLPVASAGGLATVPAGRYATASAVNASARQVGGVLGIAILSIIIAHPMPATFADAIRHGWVLAAISFAAAAVFALFLGRIRVAADTTDATLRQPRVDANPDRTVVTSPPPTEPDFWELLPADAREQLLGVGEPVVLQAGETLFKFGDPGDALFVLMEGRLEVRWSDQSVREVSPEATLGELAVLTGAPRSATVSARRDSTLVRIDRAAFERLSGANTALMAAVAQSIAFRLQSSRPLHPPGPPSPKIIALIPVGRVPMELMELFAETFQRALGTRITVCRLEEGAPASALRQAEEQAGRVLLVGGSCDQWTETCLRQADRVVLVTAEPSPAQIPQPAVPSDVVSVGPAPSRDQLVAWHDKCASRRVYDLGSDPTHWSAGLVPLAARLSGTSVGLVLAGGGARSLAHIGVLHAFERAGIEVDRLAGTSVGSLIASLYATGASAQEVDARVFEEFVQRNPFSDYRPSAASLARGKRGKAMLHRCFGDSLLEELHREVVVVSTDLYERVPVYYRRGVTREVVAASICLPVLFPPQHLDGRVLVDGTLTDNCPTAPLCEVPEGPVVAVRIGTATSKARGDRTPSLGETLVRVMQMADRQTDDEADEARATVTVTPDTRGIGLLEFHLIEQAREAGLAAGEAAIAALRVGDRSPKVY